MKKSSEVAQATLTELNAVLRRATFVEGYGFKAVAMGRGECQLRVPFQVRSERPGGIINGITIMGAADVAMWLAIMTLRGTAEAWVTTDLKTSFLRSGKKEPLLCTARVLKLGKRTAYGTVECVGAKTGLVAHHTVTYARIETPALPNTESSP